MLTLDLQVIGQRHKDLKNGLTAPPKPTLANIVNLMTKPRWCLGMLGTRRHGFGNLVGHAKGVSDMRSLAAWTNEQFDPRLSWADVEWVKQRWGGKLILKGIMDVEDARLAVDSRRRRADRRQQPRRPAARRRAIVASRRCRRSWTRSARKSRCGWTAASAPGRTC